MQNTILFVTKNHTLNRNIPTELQRYGLSVEPIISDNINTFFIQRYAPGVIILDTDIPEDTQSYALCQQLTSDPATEHIPVIVLTPEQESRIDPSTFETGVYDYICKDIFVVRNLVEVLRHLNMF